MKKGVPKIESKHGARTGVTFDEIKKWIEKWQEVRAKVPSNLEAFKELTSMGIRYRDYRTIKTHLERILPLVNDAPISALIDLVNDLESRMSVKEFMQLIRERFPAEELEPKFAILADVLIKELPPPGDVVKALGSILAGGFPFDLRREKK